MRLGARERSHAQPTGNLGSTNSLHQDQHLLLFGHQLSIIWINWQWEIDSKVHFHRLFPLSYIQNMNWEALQVKISLYHDSDLRWKLRFLLSQLWELCIFHHSNWFQLVYPKSRDPIYTRIKKINFWNNQLTFVQGLIVGPTPNPVVFPCLSRRILLSKKLLPVRYFPATAITAILLFIRSSLCKSSSASGAK